MRIAWMGCHVRTPSLGPQLSDVGNIRHAIKTMMTSCSMAQRALGAFGITPSRYAKWPMTKESKLINSRSNKQTNNADLCDIDSSRSSQLYIYIISYFKDFIMSTKTPRNSSANYMILNFCLINLA